MQPIGNPSSWSEFGFHLLPYALASVVMSIGVKMLLVDIFKIRAFWLLGAVAVTPAATVALSVLRPAKDSARPWCADPSCPPAPRPN